jgi:hypothetical protein
MNEIQALDIQVPAEIIHSWGWFLAFGVGLVALGVAAVVRSVAATVVSMLFFGWLLVIAAGIEVAQTVMVGQWAGMFQHLLAPPYLKKHFGKGTPITQIRNQLACHYKDEGELIGANFESLATPRNKQSTRQPVGGLPSLGYQAGGRKGHA